MSVNSIRIEQRVAGSRSWWWATCFFVLINALLVVVGATVFFTLFFAIIHAWPDVAILDHYAGEQVRIVFWGSIVHLLVTCHGFLSGIMKSYRGVIATGIPLFGLLVGTIVCTIVIFTGDKLMSDNIISQLTYEMENYMDNAPYLYYLHTSFSCCGIFGPANWETTIGFIPGICCNSSMPCREYEVTQPGCIYKLSSTMSFFVLMYWIIVVTACIAEVSCILLIVFFWRTIATIKRFYKTPRKSPLALPRPHTTIIPRSSALNSMQISCIQ